MIRTAKEKQEEWVGYTHTHGHTQICTHTHSSTHPYIVQSVVNICFTTLFALGWNLQPFFMRQTDVAELSLEMGPELFSDGYVYLFSAAFWRGFSESYFVSHPANIWWASARLPPSSYSPCLPIGRGAEAKVIAAKCIWNITIWYHWMAQLGHLLMVARQFDNV